MSELIFEWLRRTGMVGIMLVLAGCGHVDSTMTAITPASQPIVATAAATMPAGFVNVRAIIVVRHGDIDGRHKAEMGNAAPLTKRGEERARELAYALKDAGVTRIVTTEALRTKETAAVLAEELGIQEEVAAGHGPEKAGMPMASEAGVVMAYLSRTGKPGDVILLVHHHSVIPDILRRFGYPEEKAFDDATEFDRMYVILPDAGKGTYQVLRVRYGARSDNGAGVK